MKGKESDKFIKNFSDVAEMVEYFDDINNRGICIIPNRLNMSDIFDVIYDISVDKERELIKYTLYQNTLKDEIIHFKMCLPYSAFFTYIRCNYLIPNLVYDNFRYRIKNIIYRTDNMCKYFLDKTKNGKMIYDNKLDKRKINIPLFYLGQSFLKLAESDIACFCKGWEDARGCVLEHSAAKTYGIETIYL